MEPCKRNFIGGRDLPIGRVEQHGDQRLPQRTCGSFTPAIQNFEVGALNTSSTFSFSGIIVNNAASNAQTGNSDAAANNLVALTKVGTGTLTLIGANTDTGPMTISGGAYELGNGGI